MTIIYNDFTDSYKSIFLYHFCNPSNIMKIPYSHFKFFFCKQKGWLDFNPNTLTYLSKKSHTDSISYSLSPFIKLNNLLITTPEFASKHCLLAHILQLSDISQFINS